MKNTIRPKPLTAASGTHLTLTLPAKVSTLAPNSGTGFPEIWSSPSGWTSTTSSSLRMLNHNNHFHVQGARPTAVFRFILRNTVSPDAIIAQLHFVDSQGLDRSYLSTYVQKVMEVKPTDVQGVAETYLVPSKMTIVVVGDKAKIADQIAPYEAATE